MKIVILDGYAENPGDLSWSPLEAYGELTVYDRTPVKDTALIIERIGDAEIVISNKTPITKEIIDACPSIKVIAVIATGYNVIDYKYAGEKNIPVLNVPGYGTDIVAQFTVGLLLEICSHFQKHSDSVHNGDWENCPDFCYWNYPMIELAGKTAGVIGFGRIGQATGKILKAMGMKILASGSRPTESGLAIAEYVDLDTLYAKSDVILLHCPLFPENTGMINTDSIAKMKDGVIIINTGRGPLIVEQDLAAALNSGKVYAAAMDVVSTEPIKGDNPLLGAKNCLLTPHIAWAAKESRQRILDITVENIRCFLEGHPQNAVNM